MREYRTSWDEAAFVFFLTYWDGEQRKEGRKESFSFVFPFSPSLLLSAGIERKESSVRLYDGKESPKDSFSFLIFLHDSLSARSLSSLSSSFFSLFFLDQANKPGHREVSRSSLSYRRKKDDTPAALGKHSSSRDDDRVFYRLSFSLPFLTHPERKKKEKDLKGTSPKQERLSACFQRRKKGQIRGAWKSRRVISQIWASRPILVSPPLHEE